jgi:hypothetical protein
MPYYMTSWKTGWWSSNGLDSFWSILSSNPSWNTAFPDWGFHGFPESLQVNAVAPQLGHSCFLPNSFQFVIIHQWF